jgi:hypothetical protein
MESVVEILRNDKNDKNIFLVPNVFIIVNFKKFYM